MASGFRARSRSPCSRQRRNPRCACPEKRIAPYELARSYADVARPPLAHDGPHRDPWAALATIDRSAEKAHLTLLARQQAAQLQRASDQLLRGGRRRLAELGPLDSFEFRLFLELPAQALAASTAMGTRSHAYSADGSLCIVLEPMAGAEWVDVPTTDGIFAAASSAHAGRTAGWRIRTGSTTS